MISRRDSGGRRAQRPSYAPSYSGSILNCKSLLSSIARSASTGSRRSYLSSGTPLALVDSTKPSCQKRMGKRSGTCGPRIRLVRVGAGQFFSNGLEGFLGGADVAIVRIKRAFVDGKTRKHLAAVKI